MKKRILILYLISCFLFSSLYVKPIEMIDEPQKIVSIGELYSPPIIFDETLDYIEVNFSMFTFRFFKGSSGYNEIYDVNGSILVYNERMFLEYLGSGNKWKQRGIPIDINWIKIDDYHYEVTRFYDDFLGTTYNVTYTIISNNPIKISINIESSQTDNYRFSWELSGIVKTDFIEKENSLVFGNEKILFDWIVFDWEDVYQRLGNITDYSIEIHSKGRKADIHFDLGIIESGQKFFLDPYSVGDGTTSSTYDPFQRKFFGATNGYFYAFYSDGSDLIYEYTDDKTDWSGTENVFAPNNNGYDLAVFYDENNNRVHYARIQGSYWKYRSGNLQSDGSISWVASEYSYYCAGVIYGINIIVDSGGYPWIGYTDTIGADEPIITKSSQNDGTWVTQSGFPYKLSSTSMSSWRVTPIPLTSEKVYVIYTYGGSNTFGKLWSGSWGSEESGFVSSNFWYWRYSAIGVGDDVFLAFSEYSFPYDVISLKRTYGTGWGSEETVESSTTSDTTPILSYRNANDTVFCLWEESDVVYYKKRPLTGSWDVSKTTLCSESGLKGKTVTGYYKDYLTIIGLAWVQETGSPDTVRFYFIQLPPEIVNDKCESSDPTPQDGEYFFVNATLLINPDTSYFEFVRIDLDPTGLNLSMSYNNLTDTFQEENDPNNYIFLDVSTSNIFDISEIKVRVNFYFKFFMNVTKEGAYDVQVFSKANGSNDTDTFTSVFTLVIGVPDIPSKFFGAGFNDSTPYVELRWDHNLLLVDFFEIQNSSNKVDWDYLNKTTLKYYMDYQVENGTERYYKIRSCRDVGSGWKNSSFSDINFEKVYFIKEVVGDEEEDEEPLYEGISISYWFILTLWGGLFVIGLKYNEIMVLSSILGLIFGVLFLRENSIIGLVLIMLNLITFSKALMDL